MRAKPPRAIELIIMFNPPASSETDVSPCSHSRAVRPVCRGWIKIFQALLFSTLIGHVHADVKKKVDEKNKKESYAPEVRNSAATFVAGQSVDIELTASVGTLQQVEFIIRQGPLNGTLSPVRPHPRDTNKGVVTYTHRDRTAPLTDSFTFASRVDGGPMSAPGTVTLTGRGFEPRLSILAVSVADKVFPGGESTIKISLKNHGDAPFARGLKWDAPWRGPPHMELKAGESADFLIVFKPADTGIFRSTVELQPGTESSKFLLYGECVRALTVSPSRLQLLLNPESGAREGTLSLADGRSDSVHVEVRTTQRLQGGGAFDVKGGSKTDVILRLPASDVAAFHGEVVVSTQEGTETVIVEAAAKAHDLRMIAPDHGVLDMGRMELGTTAHGEIQLRNSGGLPAIVEAQAFPPLMVTPVHQTLRVEPGHQVTFAVSLKGEQIGSFQSEVRIVGGDSMMRVPVNVEITSPKENPKKATTSTPSGTPAPPLKTNDSVPVVEISPDVAPTELQKIVAGYLRSKGMPIPMDKINPYLERIKEVSVVHRTSSSITLSWKKPEIMPAKWEVETSFIQAVPEAKTFIKVWRTFKTWEPVPVDADKIGIRLHTLPEAAQIEIRIMGVDRDGKFSPSSNALVLETLSAWHLPPWFWYLLIVVALVIVIYYLIRIRRGDFTK